MNHLVEIIMGSKSDWETMKHTSEVLDSLEIDHHVEIVSAHRTPEKLFSFSKGAEDRGVEVIIAGAGGAAHLPGMCAALTTIPVLGVPVASKNFKGMDSLMSIVQMPKGIPVGTLAVGPAGAANAALLAAAILSNKYKKIRQAIHHFREEQTNTVLENPNPRDVS